jgi:hypothetical protein
MRSFVELRAFIETRQESRLNLVAISGCGSRQRQVSLSDILFSDTRAAAA